MRLSSRIPPLASVLFLSLSCARTGVDVRALSPEVRPPHYVGSKVGTPLELAMDRSLGDAVYGSAETLEIRNLDAFVKRDLVKGFSRSFEKVEVVPSDEPMLTERSLRADVRIERFDWADASPERKTLTLVWTVKVRSQWAIFLEFHGKSEASSPVASQELVEQVLTDANNQLWEKWEHSGARAKTTIWSQGLL